MYTEVRRNEQKRGEYYIKEWVEEGEQSIQTYYDGGSFWKDRKAEFSRDRVVKDTRKEYREFGYCL